MGTPAPLSRPFDLSGKLDPQLSDQLIHLDYPISDPEILQAITDMPKGKASGPDGLPCEFF